LLFDIVLSKNIKNNTIKLLQHLGGSSLQWHTSHSLLHPKTLSQNLSGSREAEAMDLATTTAAAPAACIVVKKQAKDMTSEEQKAKSEKCAGRREATRIHVFTTRLDEEQRQVNDHYLFAQATANSEELAEKAAARVVMLMKQEALNVAFDDGAVIPGQPVAGVSSTSSVTSTPSGRPPPEPRTPSGRPPPEPKDWWRALPVGRALADVVGVGRACHAIDLNQTSMAGDTTLAWGKKQQRISVAAMPPGVNLFDGMPS
jgi:hypothetical protein